MLQCVVVVCCSVLQCVAVCCSMLQYVAVCCSMLQYVAVCCSVLQCVAVCCSVTSVGLVEAHNPNLPLCVLRSVWLTLTTNPHLGAESKDINTIQIAPLSKIILICSLFSQTLTDYFRVQSKVQPIAFGVPCLQPQNSISYRILRVSSAHVPLKRDQID